MLIKRYIAFCFLVGICLSSEAQKDLNSRLLETAKLNLEEHFFDGLKNYYLGNVELAEREFLRCIEINSKHHASLYELGSICVEKKEISRATSFLKQATELDPNNVWYWNKLIDLYKMVNLFEEVAQCYQKLTTIYPHEKTFYKNASSFWFATGNANKSIDIYIRYEKLHGISEDISLELERLYLFKKKPDKALKQMRRLRDSDTGSIRYMGLLAELYADLGFERDAEIMFNRIIERDPSNGAAHFALADLFALQGDYKKSNEYLIIGLKDSRVPPDQKIPLLTEKMQEIQNKKGTRAELLNYFDIVERVHPEESEFFFLHASYLAKIGNNTEAFALFEHCLELGNISEELISLLVQTDYKAKKYDKLAQHAAIGIELYPHLPFFYYYYATALTRLGEFTASMEVSRQGLELAIFEPLISAQLLKSLGNAAFQLKKYTVTDSAYQAAYQIDSFDVTLCNNYAYFLASINKDLEKAEALSIRSLNKLPDNPDFSDTYGLILFKMGRYELAEQYFNAAINSDPDNGSILEHLGDNYAKLGNEAEAIRYWKEAATKPGSSSLLERKIREKRFIE